MSRNPIPWLVIVLVESETSQSTGNCMPFKLENALQLFINVRKWVGSVLSSGLTFNFTQVKVKGRRASHSKLYTLKNIILSQKRHCEVSFIIAMN